jgi:hypothetical protein
VCTIPSVLLYSLFFSVGVPIKKLCLWSLTLLRKGSTTLCFCGAVDYSCLFDVKCEEGYQKRRTYNSQSLPWGFLFFRNPQKCVWMDRSVWLENSGGLTETTCVTKKQIQSLNVSYTGFMLFTVDFTGESSPVWVQYLGNLNQVMWCN